ncbi:hypothetical protein LMG27952_07239 [Paraburkholderia hiiakae]|uniref:Uncharacterized protein n=1 Tax=Paraburkholderia hiiakae TaxID=1081782 RepID=A0ABN7IEU6_9BURK|nr:hypothetical protein LMG27952_07239 [Paraburkholderia hiiakae]
MRHGVVTALPVSPCTQRYSVERLSPIPLRPCSPCTDRHGLAANYACLHPYLRAGARCIRSRSNESDSNEHLSQPTGLRAKILVRRPDLRPEVGGRVPGPARVKKHGPSGICAAGFEPPLETSIAAQPLASSAWTKAFASCTDQPPSTQSVADTRIVTGRSCENASRTASKTSSGKRIRFSNEPPYSSALWFERGERN